MTVSIGLLRRLGRLTYRPLWPHLPWGRRPLVAAAAGKAPFSAWEAELTAYARLRAGSSALEVHFALATETGGGEEIRLARGGLPGQRGPGQMPGVSGGSSGGPAPEGPPPGGTLLAAELALEHVLMHYRHGWREATLLWHTWAHPAEPVRLPWPPWDQVALPAAVVGLALREAIPVLTLPPETDRWPLRWREAAAWLMAAWADGRHRALEVAERPGLAERLPLPPTPGRPSTWEAVCYRLATGDTVYPISLRSGDAGGGERVLVALQRLEAASELGHLGDLGHLVERIVGLVDALRRLDAVPPGHKQRPPWLQRDWGHWCQAPAVRAALEHLARSPTSSVVATALAKGRRHAALPVAGGEAVPVRDGSARASRVEAVPEAVEGVAQPEPAIPAAPGQERGWGLQEGQSLSHRGAVPPSHDPGPGREGQGGQGETAGGGTGAGPGALGSLRVISPSAEDRAAYWQLRGALAPEIERLIERLEAASDAYYACVPRRFQRAGRLDRNRLPASMAGREATFVRFVHEPAPAHALCLLLDCSASMTSRAEQLREVAILVESAAAAVGARVTAFAFGASWERAEPAAEGAPLVALGRELHPHGGTPFGPAVAAAADWLSRQPYEQKRLWVFSDGRWSARDRADANWRPARLRDVVVWVFTEPVPEAPTPAMRIVAAPTLARLVELAPRYFWDTGGHQSGLPGPASQGTP